MPNKSIDYKSPDILNLQTLSVIFTKADHRKTKLSSRRYISRYINLFQYKPNLLSNFQMIGASCAYVPANLNH